MGALLLDGLEADAEGALLKTEVSALGALGAKGSVDEAVELPKVGWKPVEDVDVVARAEDCAANMFVVLPLGF